MSEWIGLLFIGASGVLCRTIAEHLGKLLGAEIEKPDHNQLEKIFGTPKKSLVPLALKKPMKPWVFIVLAIFRWLMGWRMVKDVFYWLAR